VHVVRDKRTRATTKERPVDEIDFEILILGVELREEFFLIKSF
jgi:hypothetical protein